MGFWGFGFRDRGLGLSKRPFDSDGVNPPAWSIRRSNDRDGQLWDPALVEVLRSGDPGCWGGLRFRSLGFRVGVAWVRGGAFYLGGWALRMLGSGFGLECPWAIWFSGMPNK